MTDSTAVLILVISFFVMLICRVPIAFAIGVSSILTTIYLEIPLMQIAQLLVMFVVLMLITYIPQIVMFLPNLLMPLN